VKTFEKEVAFYKQIFPTMISFLDLKVTFQKNIF